MGLVGVGRGYLLARRDEQLAGGHIVAAGKRGAAEIQYIPAYGHVAGAGSGGADMQDIIVDLLVVVDGLHGEPVISGQLSVDLLGSGLGELDFKVGKVVMLSPAHRHGIGQGSAELAVLVVDNENRNALLQRHRRQHEPELGSERLLLSYWHGGLETVHEHIVLSAGLHTDVRDSILSHGKGRRPGKHFAAVGVDFHGSHFDVSAIDADLDITSDVPHHQVVS